ncbi:MAG: DUF5320 domain-containing protein [Methanofastidiosum sp.]|jgi:hypothetical protein
MWKNKNMEHGPRHVYRRHEYSYNRRRHFYTKQERIDMLEEYKTWLDKEKQGVEERIEELKKSL